MNNIVKIAVVEDNQQLKNMLVKYISKISNNIYVEGYTNPEQAYKNILKERHDIIITDNIMPIMDGVELAQKILMVYDPYIILQSVMANSIRNYDLFDFCLSKPISLNNLEIIIQDIMGKIQVEDEEQLIREKTNFILSEIGCGGKDKAFLNFVLNNLMTDSDLDENIYEELSKKINKQSNTLRRKISRIINDIYDYDKFKERFGLLKKPRNLQFLNIFNRTVKEEVQNELKKQAR